ncbi:MAG: polyribonucleotide nucleotidyltransferase [Parcubacteria group bacterium]|nr:polyribonucleotide nucleotidyltransferase [Parcubacteria group bacterium]MCR4342815.1 polyribonucleotide nucleotidyltransferase [Patescibacteria group bacterium]
MHTKEYSMEIGGKTLIAEFTNLADQTSGSVIVKYGETTVLATVVMTKKEKDIGYFPLVVDYEERFYAAGQILGSRFIRREGRPTDEAILAGRAIDRTIRPLFNQSMRNEIQVVITVLAIDENNDPDVPSIIAASLAIATSETPWNGPVSAVRIGEQEGKFIVNPAYPQRIDSPIDILICGKEGKINMIEAGAKEVSEGKIKEAFLLAEKELKKIEDFQKQIINDIGKEKVAIEEKKPSEELKKLFMEHIAVKLEEVIFSNTTSEINPLKDFWLGVIKEALPEEMPIAGDYFESEIDKFVHKEAIFSNRRPDGRAMDEVRPLFAKAGALSDLLHGSGIFFRGGTHVLSVLTLGGPKEVQLVEGMEVQTEKRFMHHYNFPPFSVGDVGRMGGINRRAVGHGALAEKALEAVLPSKDEFPYTIRIVSESMASNGSTSMGSVCASTLALMDAGVPIKNPVAGIAMGLMLSEAKSARGGSEAKSAPPAGGSEQEYKVLTDIQGPEDHHGDMDFKVAGTKEGVTAIQMDVKVEGIPSKILIEALEGAKKARLKILDKITEAISAPRPETKEAAPKIIKIMINPEKIGEVIGPGGKVIKSIIEETGSEIDIEQDGSVFITGKKDAVEKAKKIVEDITREYHAGEKFDGVVTRLFDFGAMVKIGHNTEGLVHVSEIAPFRIDKVTDVVNIGDTVPVIVKEIDEKGRVNLSIKSADPLYAEKKGAKPSQGGARPGSSEQVGYNRNNERGNGKNNNNRRY